MLQHERQAWTAGHRFVAGVDEAGRGPLAGPVVAAAVHIDRYFLESESAGFFSGLKDSKQLTAPQRERFFQQFTAHALIRWGVGVAEVAEIDLINILRSTHNAMARALDRIMPEIDLALVDGLPVAGLPCKSTAIVDGDEQSCLIAAASVIAKVTRDRMMLELDQQFPQYGFARHKGYGTAEHLEALRAHGPCACHRRSFEPVRQAHINFGTATP
ncbi:MAG TPA: ribonuclease HII [Kiritimatiellia bacterium]